MAPKPPEIAATWEDIESLHPWAKNPRKNEGKPVAEVAKSIQRFGFAAPIVARTSDRRIIAGHTRWKAAKKLGMTLVPVRFVDLDEDQAAALTLADNKLSEITPWDDDALADVLREIEAAGVDMDGLGWSTEEIDALIKGSDEVPFADADDRAFDQKYAIVVECRDEEDQMLCFERLKADGYTVRVVVA